MSFTDALDTVKLLHGHQQDAAPWPNQTAAGSDGPGGAESRQSGNSVTVLGSENAHECLRVRRVAQWLVSTSPASPSVSLSLLTCHRLERRRRNHDLSWQDCEK